MDFQAVFQKQKERFVHSSADRALKSVIKQYAKFARADSPKEVAEEDMALVQHAINKGACAHQDAGAIDDLVMAPRLMHYLMEQGASPSSRYLDRLEMWRTHSLMLFHSLRPNLDTPRNAEEWMHVAVRKAISCAPDLDWQRLPVPKEGESNEPLANQLDYPFIGLSDHLRACRLSHGLPMGPQHETTDYYSNLLCELMVEHPRAKWIKKEGAQRAEMMDHLLSKGADPNARAKLNSYDDQDRSLLAQTFQKDYRLVPRLLQAGAIVDQQVINELAFVLHDRQPSLWARKEDYRDTLMRVFHHAHDPILWNSTVPSHDYYQPTLRYILEKIFPEIERDIGLMNSQVCADEIERSTTFTGPTAKPSRRL
jgi:hypothetical protein